MKFFLTGGARLCRALTFFSFAGLFFLAFAATAQTTNGLSDAEVKGQQLAQELLQDKPVTNFTQQGVLKIEDAKRKVTNAQVTLITILANDHWETRYLAAQKSNDDAVSFSLVIIHKGESPNQYFLFHDARDVMDDSRVTINNPLDKTQIMAPFADSDFWIADLGLEFFHWPGQKVIKHEERRTRECTVLESTNPEPAPGSYSYVNSWVDDETLGIVHAEAYDANKKLLKVFDPKSFKKVNGQWELQDMEIRNVQTGSRTWIKFDLSHKS